MTAMHRHWLVGLCLALAPLAGLHAQEAPSAEVSATSASEDPAKAGAAGEPSAETPTPETPAEGAGAEAAPSDEAGAAPAQPADATPTAAELKTADESYDIKIRDIEEKVNELKEKIFRSKARLLTLQEAVFSGVSSGARAVLVHRNEMGSSFRLRELHYFIDGAPLKQEVDSDGDSLSSKSEIQLFTGNIVPGNHQITVNLVYQGHGYGVFSYLNGYTFRIKSSYTFNAEEGKETTVRIVAYEKGGFTTELKDRPAVRYDVEVKKHKRRKKGDKPSPSAEALPAN